MKYSDGTFHVRLSIYCNNEGKHFIRKLKVLDKYNDIYNFLLI